MRPAACIRSWASALIASVRSTSFIPSTLRASNIRLICLLELCTAVLCCFTGFLPCDSNFASGVSENSSLRDQSPEVRQRREINLWSANTHLGAHEGIHHPARNRDDNARWAFHFEKLLGRALLYPPHTDL